MMNLALLARSASSYTHNATHLCIARSHADKTMAHHIRPDDSSFHVCDYSSLTGAVYLCGTAQGLANNSTWARGQAWGIYGFAEIYALTGDEAYLRTSQRMADRFLEHLPEDGLPFWDFDAAYKPGVTPKDSSAAIIAVSGLIMLQKQLEKSRSKSRSKSTSKYAPKLARPDTESHNVNFHDRDSRSAALLLLRSSIELALAREIRFPGSPPLGAETYLNTPATTEVSRGFESILMHGTSNNNPQADPRNFDSGLSYGDFYFVEAGNRLLELEGESGREGCFSP